MSPYLFESSFVPRHVLETRLLSLLGVCMTQTSLYTSSVSDLRPFSSPYLFENLSWTGNYLSVSVGCHWSRVLLALTCDSGVKEGNESRRRSWRSFSLWFSSVSSRDSKGILSCRTESPSPKVIFYKSVLKNKE